MQRLPNSIWKLGHSLRNYSSLKAREKPCFWRYLYWTPIAFVFAEYFYELKIISGRSMQPTLNPDSSLWRDVALFDRFAIHTQNSYRRGDIVALRSPDDPDRVLVKRIIGLEGDVVKTLPPYPDPDIQVPAGHAWVEGDEPFHSDDSNRFGCVPLALIESRLKLIVWPLNRFGHPLHRPEPLLRKNFNNQSSYQLAMAEFERERWRASRVISSRTDRQ